MANLEIFIDKVLPKCTNMEAAVENLLKEADEGARKLAEEDPIENSKYSWSLE